MPKFIVTMCRIGYGFHDIEVEAEDQVDAEAKAHDEAGNYSYNEKTSEYEVAMCREVE